MALPIRTAVFPVAGLGTRFLPATKAMPKEMLPLLDRPLIQHAVDEAFDAGIEKIVFVSSRGKTVMEDHFGGIAELYRTLEARGKTEALETVKAIDLPDGRLQVVRQSAPLGLGHAVWCARDLVGREPFAVLLPDDVVLAEKGCMRQMIEAYDKTGGNIVAVVDVPREHTQRYGILKTGTDDGRLASVEGLVEKPKPEEAPSTLSVIGRYILQPEVFDHLDRKETGAGGEIQLTDAMARLIGTQPFHGLRFEGTRFDCGDKAGWLEANIAYALQDAAMRPAMQAAIGRWHKA